MARRAQESWMPGFLGDHARGVSGRQWANGDRGDAGMTGAGDVERYSIGGGFGLDSSA